MSKTAYSNYASHYDSSVKYIFFDFVKKTIKKAHPKANDLLEIGCGTALNLELLQSHYQVEGLDLSADMLLVAKKKMPKVRFHRADMQNFKIDKQFDVILCLFDSINHVTTFKGWKDTFATVKKHLKPGGVFLFDMNTTFGMKDISKRKPFYIELKDDNFMMMKVDKSKRNIFLVKLRIFECQKNGIFKQKTEAMPELVVDEKKVAAALTDSFSGVKCYNERGVEIFDGKKWQQDQSYRLFFLCKH